MFSPALLIVLVQVSPTQAPPEPAGAHDPAAVDRYRVEVAERPTDVVRALVAAAQAGDVEAYKARLSGRFVRGVQRLQVVTRDNPELAGGFDWGVFMTATALPDLEVQREIFFYNRATVRAATPDGREIRFRLVVEEGTWRVDVPAEVEQLVNALAPTPPAEDDDGELGDDDGDEQLAPDEAAALAPEPAASGDPTRSRDVPPPLQEPQAPAVVAPAPEKPSEPKVGFFDPGSLGHYAWYVPDWAFVATSASFFALGGHHLVEPQWTLIGPRFELHAPRAAPIMDSRVDGIIGNPMVNEKVPLWVLGVGFGAGAVAFTALDALRHLEFHHTHAFVVGAATTLMATMSATEVLKLGVGRLRPDFRERYVRAACGGTVEAAPDLDCSTAPSDGFVPSREDVVDGMKSFPSGHSSTAFAMATYFSLYLGGEWIWGRGANPYAMPIAALGIGGMYAAAAFVAASRLSDNRHHVEDVAVGTALGTGVAAATYFLHFDLDGRARWRTFNFSAAPTRDGKGGVVALSGTF